MNQIFKRLVSGILALSMVWSLTAPAWAAGASSDESAVSSLAEDAGAALSDSADLGETSAEGLSDDPADGESSEPSSSEETDPADGELSEPPSAESESAQQTDPADEGDASGSGSAPAAAETDPADTDPADTSAAAVSSEPILEPEATSTKGTLTMEYDDRYTVDDIEENDNLDADLDGYTIKSVKTGTVSSYQVSKGAKTSSKDTAVLKKLSDTKVQAVGVGTATVTLTDGTDTVTYTVTVEAATLTIMFLAGQSNTEGYCATASGSDGYNHKKVVPCEPGTVYSSYGGLNKDARTKKRTQQISGVTSNPPYLNSSGSNAKDLIAGSLTSTTSISGKSLGYKLDKLTSDESSRKTGMDAGLAYRWNELTGDKVWVVNAAVGGTAIAGWSPSDGIWYSRALKFYKQALKVYKAETKAGHYKAGRRLMFWLQGEWDCNTTVSSYLKQFRTMAASFKSELSLKALGVITTRACVNKSDTVGSADLTMTGPRRAQYGLSSSTSSKDSFVYVVSNANEQWATDSGVSNYFKEKYPSGKFTYPTGIGTTRYALPTKAQSVKPDMHYTQLGHNENGVTAAEGMYQVLYQGGGTPSSVTWANAKGKAITSITCGAGETAVAVAEVNPITSAKKVTFAADGTYCTYDSATGTVTGLNAGTGTIKVLYNGTTLGTLTVNVILATPTLIASANRSDGIRIKWEKVSDADGYQIWRKTGSGKWKHIDDVSGGATVTYVDTSVKSKNGTSYTYTVRATNTAHSDWRSGYDSTGLKITRLTSVKLTRVSNKSKKKLYAAWKKNSKCSGYQLQYSTSKDFSSKKSVKVSGSGKLSKTVSKLKKGKTYYVRVRCYKTVSGVTSYSAWSDTLKVKIKK